MQPLMPSQKENKRYLLLRLGSSKEESKSALPKLGQDKGKSLKEDVEKSVYEFIGVLGMSKASLAWIKTDKDWAIISINRESLNHVRASFAASSYDIKVERVSGTLKGLDVKGKK